MQCHAQSYAQSGADPSTLSTPQEAEVAPVIVDYWEKAEFPFKLLPGFAKLNLAGGTIHGFGCPVSSCTTSLGLSRCFGQTWVTAHVTKSFRQILTTLAEAGCCSHGLVIQLWPCIMNSRESLFGTVKRNNWCKLRCLLPLSTMHA